MDKKRGRSRAKRGKRSAAQQVVRLRRKAEAQLGATSSARLPRPPKTRQAIQKLVQELLIHQAELEIQNEELRRAQTETEQACRKYQDLYETVPAGCFTVDARGRIHDANPAGAALLRHPPSSVIGRRFQEFVDEKDRHAFVAFCRRVLDGQVHETREFRLWDGAVSTESVLLVGAPSEGLGTVSTLSLTVTDVTRLKQVQAVLREANEELEHKVNERTNQLAEALAELKRQLVERNHTYEALHESEERFRRIFHHAGTGIAIIEWDGRFVQCNPAYCVLTGYSQEELFSQDLLALLHPDDRGEVGTAIRALMNRDVPSFEIEHRYAHRSGEPVWAQTSVSALRAEDGTPTHLIVLVTDISRRKRAEAALQESEQRLRLALSGAQMGTWEWDLASDRLEWSDREFELFGVDKRNFSGSGTQALAAIHPEDRASVEGALLLTKEQGVEFREEFRVIHQDGSIHWLAGIGRRVHDGVGMRDHVIGVNFDVTKRKEIEEAISKANLTLELRVDERTADLQRMNEMLRIEQAERIRMEQQFLQSQKLEAVGRLAGGLAHDFNNMMTVIQGYSSLLKEQFTPTDGAWGQLQEIEQASERAIALTRQLLIFSRRQAVNPQPVNLSKLTEHLTKMLRRLVGEQIEVRLDLAEPLSTIIADPGELEQVIVNLIVNARDAMPGGGTITLTTSEARADQARTLNFGFLGSGNYVALTITDTGVGMESETLSHAFEPFFTTKEPGKGTGLGLAMVHGAVTRCQGAMQVDSVVSRGTTITLYFPASELSAESQAEAPAGAKARGGPETILLVEDESSVRRLLAEVLAGHGYRVLEAADGVDALRVVDEGVEDIRLVVTDARMPRMGGRELIERLKQVRPGIKWLLMSGYMEEADQPSMASGEPIPFLPKPITPSALLEKIRSELDRLP